MMVADPPNAPARRLLPPFALVFLAALPFVASSSLAGESPHRLYGEDPVRAIQEEAAETGHSPFVHWGTDPADYAGYGSHSNRLVPVYTYGTAAAGEGVDLGSYTGERSVYRDEERLAELYGRLPAATLNQGAEYFDQTDLFHLQKAALDAGKRNIFLIVFDGLDWDSTLAAAITATGEAYGRGRGRGLFLLDHDAGGTTQFGSMVVSPYGKGAKIDVDAQSVTGVEPGGGYDPLQGGALPWQPPGPSGYLLGRVVHAVTDSSASATSMTAGIKTYNGALNVDPQGRQVTTIAHLAQQRGFAVGVVSSVPFSHATPAAAYAHNVSRRDYQDIARDMLGLPSISHPERPLPGLDVALGAGFGRQRTTMPAQGANFVPGTVYIAEDDLRAVEEAGRYVVSQRRPGVDGGAALLAAADKAANSGRRLFGFFGTQYAHLPFSTADGDFRPARDPDGPGESYTPEDLLENPTLEEMTRAALTVLAKRGEGIWLMVEAGDVDWASHDNNLDSMIGAIHSGDAAVRSIADWVEANSSWMESLMIVTGDHGLCLVVDEPAAFADAVRGTR